MVRDKDATYYCIGYDTQHCHTRYSAGLGPRAPHRTMYERLLFDGDEREYEQWEIKISRSYEIAET